MNLRNISYLIFSCLTNLALGQILDTAEIHRYKPIEVYSFSEEDIKFGELDSISIDTQLNLFHNYYPAYQNEFPFVDLGLEASPILLLSQGNESVLALDLGFTSTDPLFFDSEVQIHHTPRPFTRLVYSQGNNEMLHIDVKHVQQISERLTFGVDYRRIKNQNLYFSNIQNIASARINSLFNNKFYVGYYSPTRKYEVVASYLWNKSENVESGGLVSDSVFNSQEGRIKLNNNNVVLDDVSSQYAQNRFKVTQYFRPDGLSTDSTLDQSLTQFNSQFFHTISLDNHRVTYEDKGPDSASYGAIFTGFKDSIHHQSFENELGYSFVYKPFSIIVSLSQVFDKVYLNGNRSNYQSIYLNGKTGLKYKRFGIEGDARIGVVGFNLGDYHIKGQATTEIKKTKIGFGMLSQLVEPSFIQQKFNSTPISWTSKFTKISINQLFGNAILTKGNHEVIGNIKAQTAFGLVYFDADIFAKQYGDLVSLLMTRINYQYTGDFGGAEFSTILQNSSNQRVLPRPATSLTGNIYGKFSLFKRNLKVQIGARSYWFSSFRSPRYNPYTRQWHNSEDTFDSYPPISVYLNGKVKTFCFGMEFFHIQEGLMGHEYYSSPSYPMMPRSFRLHLRWDLNN